MLVNGREGLGPGAVNSNVAWTGEPRAIWWLSIEGFRSKLNIRRSSPLQAIPSKPFLPLPPECLAFEASSLCSPSPFPFFPVPSGCQAVRFDRINRVLALWLSGLSVPPALRVLLQKNVFPLSDRGHHQCHGRDVGQENPSPPTCMRRSTQLTQPNEQPAGQSGCRAAVTPVLSPVLSGVVLTPAPRIISEFLPASHDARLAAEKAVYHTAHVVACRRTSHNRINPDNVSGNSCATNLSTAARHPTAHNLLVVPTKHHARAGFAK